MAIFYNQASLSFNGQITNSNIVTGEIVSSLSFTKTAISQVYGASDRVSYAISIVNGSGAARNNITLTDNLGAYVVGNTIAVPLDYVEGSLRFFLNGILQPAPTVTAGPPLSITGIDIPSGANAVIIYEAITNSFAPVAEGGTITNAATLTGLGSETLTDSATINARSEARLTISKAISPDTITEDGELTYTFVIQNTGNTPVVATDNVIVTDIFNPILNPISVTLNGTALAEGTGYTYNNITGEFATVAGVVTVPAATYLTDPETGAVSVTPGVAVLTVTGNV